MTREEQIRKNANAYTLSVFGELDDFWDVTDGFVDGAKWADENPKEGLVSIDKACEWLGNRDIMERILHCRTSLIDDYVKEFRKAMEE